MRYAIEIMESYYAIDEYTSDDIGEVLKWYRKNYKEDCDNGFVKFDLYKDDNYLTFEECYLLGFYEEEGEQ